MPRYFSREEAERLLPQIRPLMEEAQRRALSYQQLQGQVESLEARLKGNGHLGEGKALEERQRAFAELRDSIARLVDEVQSLGVEVKDLSMGLVDFRARREGDEIYLCWRVGERRIEWWHPLEGGFGARQRLP